MKTAFPMILGCCLVILFSGSLSANVGSSSPVDQELIIRNLLHGLESPLVEIRANALQSLADLKKRNPDWNFDQSVIPVMDLLKSDDHPEVRILSAIALYHLDSAKGRFAVQRRTMYDPSPRVADMCSRVMMEWTNRGKATSPAVAVL